MIKIHENAYKGKIYANGDDLMTITKKIAKNLNYIRRSYFANNYFNWNNEKIKFYLLKSKYINEALWKNDVT